MTQRTVVLIGPERKSDKVRMLVAERHFKEALRIASDFKLGISQEEKDKMKRGYECIVHPEFYRSIGIDPIKASQEAIDVITNLYT